MAIDVARVVQAAIQAATEEPPSQSSPKKPRLPVGRAVLIGAGLMTAGRFVAGSKGRALLGSIQERLALPSGDEDEADEDYEDEADEDYEDEAEDEADEDHDDEPETAADDETDDTPRRGRRSRSGQRSRS